jgi:uncharacterized protein YgiM (DUF1202 family)
MKKKLLGLFLLLSLTISMFFVQTAFASGAERQAQFAIPVLVANSSFLNIRSGDGPQYTVLVTVVGGTELSVLGKNPSGTWYLVTTPIGPGWVDVSLTLARGNFSNVPVVRPTFGATVQLPTPLSIGLPGSIAYTPVTTSTQTSLQARTRAVLNVLSVNVRAQPRGDSPAIGTIFQNETIDYPIVGQTFDTQHVGWVAIDVPDLGTGWIEAPKITTRLSGAYSTVVIVNIATIDLLVRPGDTRLNLPTLFQGQEAFLINASEDGRYYEVELLNGVTGWLPADKVLIRTGTPTDGLFDEEAAAAAAAATDMTYTVTYPTDAYGIPIPVLEAPHIVVNTTYQNIRSGPGGQFTAIATVAGGATFVPLGITKDFAWYLVRGDFGQGWISSEFVLFRGTFSNVPIIQSLY